MPVAEPARPGRGPLQRGLLGAAAPLLVAVGLLLFDGSLGGAGGDGAPTEPATAVEVRMTRASPSSAQVAASRGRTPVAVSVPALGVDASVSAIQLEGGALTPPADPQRVGWWSEGARPGASTGSAVLTGHTVHTGGGAFDDLEVLVPGDEVVVRTGRGPLAYDVVSVSVLGRGELARRSADIFDQSGPARLILITCEDWDGTAYLSNVVVTARPTDG